MAVAYSGGRDSTALLHATLRAATALGISVVALHVHHGLSPRADDWLRHCREVCRRWSRIGRPMRFTAERIGGSPPPGASVEAWARNERYAALRRMALAEGASLVLLGHHRRDQAETLLLQALRGAGVDGLSGMPPQADREDLVWARPWLGRAREDIEAYVRRHRLAALEDESNLDPRYARNRLRLSVWPALTAAFPTAEASLARAASWAQEASAALAELAAMDLAVIQRHGALELATWAALSPARRSNALRAWLRHCTGGPASARLVERLCEELPRVRDGRWLVATGELRSHRGSLVWLPGPLPGAADARPSPEAALAIARAGLYRLPGWAGALQAVEAGEGGLGLQTLACLELRPRGGAERFQAGPARPPRPLKKQYQMAGVPPWLRTGPIAYSAGRLVFVPGLGVDARRLAGPGEPQLRLDWIPDRTGP